VGQLSRKDRHAFAMVFVSMARQDARAMAVNMKKLAVEDSIKDMRAFESDLQELIDDYASLSVDEGSIADLTNELQKIMLHYQMYMPPGVFLVFRALAILEGIGKIMYPQLKTYEHIKPYGMKILQDQWAPENVWNEVQYRAEQVTSFLTSFPVEVREILQQASRGKIQFIIEHQGYGYLLKKLDSLTNRINFTLIISSLIIGSSILATVPFPEVFISPQTGLPYVSLAGFWIAGGLFVVLLYATLRRRFYK
jgi:ubiquinone biosynthesis protein